MKIERKRVIVVGGGVGGLATANLLAAAGARVSVYEKDKQLGGRMGVHIEQGFKFDTGPSWYLMPRVFEHYYDLLGKRVQDEYNLTRLKPAYKVFFEHRQPLTVHGDLERDMDSFESVEIGAGQALRKYVHSARKTYEIALSYFLYTNFESIRDVLKPEVLVRGFSLLRLLMLPVHTYVSRYVRSKVLQQILEYPMVFLGSSPFTAPAMYSLMSALDFDEGVYYPQGGMYEVVKSLVRIGREKGVDYVSGVEIEEILVSGGTARGVRTVDGEEVLADIVISNADLHHTETKLLSDAASRTYPESYWRKKEPGISALLVYIGVKGPLPQLQHHNLFFVDTWRENFSAIYDESRMPQPASLYVCCPSKSDVTVAPNDSENLFILVPIPASITLSDAEQEGFVRDYLAQFASMAKINDFTQRVVVKRVFGPDDFRTRYYSWEASALGLSHRLSQSAVFRPRTKSKKVKNLYYVGGSTAPGIGVPMCLISAELVYKRIIGERRGGRVVAPSASRRSK